MKHPNTLDGYKTKKILIIKLFLEDKKHPKNIIIKMGRLSFRKGKGGFGVSSNIFGFNAYTTSFTNIYPQLQKRGQTNQRNWKSTETEYEMKHDDDDE